MMMRRLPKCAAMAAVLTILLIASGEEARVLSGGGGGDPPSSSSAVEHGEDVVRKLLNSTTAATAAARKITSPDECSEESVVVSQDASGGRFLPNGIPYYTVAITNTCLGCTVRDVHVSCGEFASSELVSPSDFRRVAVGDCLVRDGGPMGPGDSVAFEYSNSFPYDLQVASVSCA